MSKLWFNYILFNNNNNKTYIGSTVNLIRRIRQHNGIIKGGAKYTRNGKWSYYCLLYHLDNTINTVLSYEWHLKYTTRKKTNKKLTSKLKRKQALELFLMKKSKYKYDHILFIFKNFIYLTPNLSNNIFIIYLDNIDINQIYYYINLVTKFNLYNTTNL